MPKQLSRRVGTRTRREGKDWGGDPTQVTRFRQVTPRLGAAGRERRKSAYSARVACSPLRGHGQQLLQLGKVLGYVHNDHLVILEGDGAGQDLLHVLLPGDGRVLLLQLVDLHWVVQLGGVAPLLVGQRDLAAATKRSVWILPPGQASDNGKSLSTIPYTNYVIPKRKQKRSRAKYFELFWTKSRTGAQLLLRGICSLL